MDVYGGGGTGCNTNTGRFEVRQLTRSANGAVAAFWATFEQHCGGIVPALRGEVRCNADTSLYASSPALVFTYPQRPVTFAVVAAAADQRPLHLSCAAPPPGSSFVDHGDGTGALLCPTGFATAQSFTIPFTAVNDLGIAATTTTKLFVFWPDVFRFSVPPFASYVFTPPDRPFDLRMVWGNVLDLEYANAGHSWSWQISSALTPTPEAGVYSTAGSPSISNYFQSAYDQNLCGVSAGMLQVRKAAYGADGRPTALWAVFDQTCNGTRQLGEVRINADTSLYLTAPATVFVTPRQAVSFDITATDAATRPVILSAMGMPVGAQVVSVGPSAWHFEWQAGDSTLGDRIVRTRAQDDQGASAEATTTIRIHSPDLVRLASEPGDPVGLGSSVQYTPAQGAIRVIPLYGPGVQFTYAGSGHWWTGNFVAPSARSMTPGIYTDAARYDYQAADQPGLEFMGDERRCTALSGTFQIRRISYSGSNIASLWATFRQRCDAYPGSLNGELRFNADTSLYVGSLADVSALSGVPVAVEVAGADLRGRPLQLFAPDSPAGAMFTDHGDGTGTLRWDMPPPVDQDMAIRFLARSSASDTAISNTVIHVGQPQLLILTSPPGDPIGQGLTSRFASTDGAFDGAVNADSSVTVHFAGAGHTYALTFAAAGGHLPRAGRYSWAYQKRGTPATGPWLDIQRDDRACATTNGSFNVRELAISDGGSLRAFWATFSQQCEGNPALTGEIRFAPSGVVPTLISTIESRLVDGRAQLRWYSDDAGIVRVALQRRANDQPWDGLTMLDRDGSGYFCFEDMNVEPGARYGYRLGVRGGGVEKFYGETWISVPALALVLEGLRPNPAVGELVASFTLPSGSPARLELVDVTGRVWLAREVGNLGAGSHLMRLGSSMPAGMYWLRLTQGGRSLLARGALVR
jgi:hypothetical protein